jgi:hypothetical protein
MLRRLYYSQNKNGRRRGMDQEIQRSQSSVEISSNGKGEKSWKVKAYADTIDEAIQLAIEADKKVAAELSK